MAELCSDILVDVRQLELVEEVARASCARAMPICIPLLCVCVSHFLSLSLTHTHSLTLTHTLSVCLSVSLSLCLSVCVSLSPPLFFSSFSSFFPFELVCFEQTFEIVDPIGPAGTEASWECLIASEETKGAVAKSA